MQQIIKKIAQQYQVSPDQVREEITAAIHIGMACQEKEVRQRWAEVPKQKDVPSAEEVIAFLTASALDCCEKIPSAQLKF